MSETLRQVLYWTVTALIIALLVFFFYILWQEVDTRNVYLPKPATYQSILGEAEGSIIPQRIVIPKLSVVSEAEHVGRDRQGRMAVPREFENVGWFREGFAPGENGGAVFAGHLDDGKGDPAIFFHLDQLEAGDRVIVESDDEMLEYAVTEKRYYDYDSQDTEEIFGPADKSKLSLITCDGSWIEGERTYDTRLVVFAELVE